MPDDDKLTPADPHDLAEAIAFALRYRGKKRVHQAEEYMAQIAAERIVRALGAGALRRDEKASPRGSLCAWTGIREMTDR